MRPTRGYHNPHFDPANPVIVSSAFYFSKKPQRKQRRQRKQSLGTRSSPNQEDTELGDLVIPKPRDP